MALNMVNRYTENILSSALSFVKQSELDAIAKQRLRHKKGEKIKKKDAHHLIFSSIKSEKRLKSVQTMKPKKIADMLNLEL